MAQYFKYVIKHDDGYTQSYVGNPQRNEFMAEQERIRLGIDESYNLKHLSIVKMAD